MNKSLLTQSYKELYRFARLFDGCPSLKFVMSDVIKSTVSSMSMSTPKWFSPDLRKLHPSLLDETLTYYPAKSAVDFLKEQFKPLPIPVKEERVVSSISHYLDFCSAVLESATKNYRINMFTTLLEQNQESVAYHKDRELFEKMQLHRCAVQSVKDLSPGSLLINYPTVMVSRNAFESALNRSEVFLITDVSELGVRGLVLNPKNIKAYTQTIDGFQVRVISSRQQEVSRPVFLIPNTPLHTCLETSEVPLGKGESMTVTPDWEGVLRECGQKANQIITRFDQLKSIPYPFILDSFSSSSSTIQSIMENISSGTVLLLKADTLNPLLFDQTLSRRMLHSNIYHSLGGEWSFIANALERMIH